MDASPSVTDPISPAIDRAGRILFRPFDPAVWFVLGFCAWLARLGESGGSAGWRASSDGSSFERTTTGFGRAFDEHLALVLVLTIVLFVVVVAIMLLVLWVSSRGKLMFVDGVVRERAAVVEPWHRFRRQGNALFLFRLVLAVAGFVVVGLLVGLLAVTVFATGASWDEPAGPFVFLALIGWFAVVATVVIAFALVTLLTNDFVVPAMWVHECGPVDGWGHVLPLLSAHPGTIVLYVFVRIIIAVVLVALTLIGCCATCCLALVPYLGTVLLLPLHVFRRGYSIEFLGQLGGPWARLVDGAGTPTP